MPTTLRDYVDRILQNGAPPSQLIRDLAAATAAEDPRAFAAQVKQIDWSTRTADELDKAFSMALSLNMTLLARDFAHQGATLFPEYEPLQRAARMFAPGKVRTVQGMPRKGLKESHEWMKNHAEAYRGQWIAVNQGQLIGAAPTLDELRTIIRQHEDTESTIVHWVIP